MLDAPVHEIPAATLSSEREVRAMLPRQRLARARWVFLPYSEAACHLRIAGQQRPVVALAGGMAQVLKDDGELLSFPITSGEAGV